MKISPLCTYSHEILSLIAGFDVLSVFVLDLILRHPFMGKTLTTNIDVILRINAEKFNVIPVRIIQDFKIATT